MYYGRVRKSCQLTNLFPSILRRSVNVFQSTLVKPEFRSVTPVGSCTAWSMEFSLMAKCPATKLSAEETIPSTHSSARPERENTFLVPCSLIWNQPLSVSVRKCLECFTLSVFVSSKISKLLCKYFCSKA